MSGNDVRGRSEGYPEGMGAVRTWTRSGADAGEFRFSEVLSALSFALDLVEGLPEGHTVRSCLVGMRIADRLGLDEERRSAFFYALLLKDAGCSSNASKVSTLFDADDMRAKKNVKTVDWTSMPHAALYAARTVSPEGSLLAKAGRMFKFAVRGQEASRDLIRIRSERGAEITRLMGFPEETAQAIRASTSIGTAGAARTAWRARRYRFSRGSAASPRRSRSF